MHFADLKQPNMTLATHMATGAAISGLFATSPGQAFLVGWLTHYLFDTIVHWDYPIASYSSEKSKPDKTKISFGRMMIFDVSKVAIDVLIGIIIVTIFYYRFSDQNLWLFVAGALGSVVPDLAQFLYGIFKSRPLGILQKFHHFMHAEKTLSDRPVIGIGSQVSLILAVGIFLEVLL